MERNIFYARSIKMLEQHNKRTLGVGFLLGNPSSNFLITKQVRATGPSLFHHLSEVKDHFVLRAHCLCGFHKPPSYGKGFGEKGLRGCAKQMPWG